MCASVTVEYSLHTESPAVDANYLLPLSGGQDVSQCAAALCRGSYRQQWPGDEARHANRSILDVTQITPLTQHHQ